MKESPGQLANGLTAKSLKKVIHLSFIIKA
jgi:hypothetical protein